MTKRRGKGAYMISVVAEMYDIHPQTLRLYEREGLLKPSRSEGNTRLYTEEDLKRLEFILSLARDLGVNIAGIGIIVIAREKCIKLQVGLQVVIDLFDDLALLRPTGHIRLIADNEEEELLILQSLQSFTGAGRDSNFR